LREVKRLEQTVQTFLDFARLPTPTVATCDLRDLIRQAWELVETRARRQGVKLEVRLPADPVLASVDANQLTTVLVNLFLNALDVVGNGGQVEARLAQDPAGVISLSIVDSGPGIPKEILKRIFEPFATNKPHGTGLGLYLSARILAEHGGAIIAVNRPEGGACFTIRLPRPLTPAPLPLGGGVALGRAGQNHGEGL
jgi:signal transduction histidine kinase